MKAASVLLIALICTLAIRADATQGPAVSAQLLTWPRCKLSRLPEVKTFIANEAQNFPFLEVKYVGGDPRIKFFDQNNQEIGDTVDLSNYKTQEIVEFLISKGLQYSPQQTTKIDDVGAVVK